MNIILAKPGTGPGTFLRVKHKRKHPTVGDIFYAKPCDPWTGKLRDPGAEWVRWYCDGVQGTPEGAMLLLARM